MKLTKEELDAMVREIHQAADEYVANMSALREKRRALFDVWADVVDEEKSEDIQEQLYGN